MLHYVQSLPATRASSGHGCSWPVLPKPLSNVVYLTKSDLAGFGPEVCRVARNEIYARHGRIFTDEILKAYFESKS
ncbi:MAG: YARHG domain-containing protein, partial [Bacteroidales bacterium]|nr:YARHG domain-containing protein [Bacteroidales bacterium]